MKDEKSFEELRFNIEGIVLELIRKHHRPANEIILDDVDIRDLLKISRRTALNYRDSGKLKNYRIQNKIFYFLSDILEFIKSNGGVDETK